MLRSNSFISRPYSCARNTCAGRAAIGRQANTSPASSVANTPPNTMPKAESGSNA